MNGKAASQNGYSRHDMALDTVGPNRERLVPVPCPHLPKRDGCICRHCRGVCLCDRYSADV